MSFIAAFTFFLNLQMLTKVGCYVGRDNNYVVHCCKSAAYAYTVYYVLHNEVERKANHPFFLFLADHCLCHVAGDPVLVLVPGPGCIFM